MSNLRVTQYDFWAVISKFAVVSQINEIIIGVINEKTDKISSRKVRFEPKSIFHLIEAIVNNAARIVSHTDFGPTQIERKGRGNFIGPIFLACLNGSTWDDVYRTHIRMYKREDDGTMHPLPYGLCMVENEEIAHLLENLEAAYLRARLLIGTEKGKVLEGVKEITNENLANMTFDLIGETVSRKLPPSHDLYTYRNDIATVIAARKAQDIFSAAIQLHDNRGEDVGAPFEGDDD